MGQVDDAALDGKNRRKAKSTAAPAGKADWKGFVNVELTQQQKDHLRTLFSDVDEAWTDVFGRVFEGCKLSLVFDAPHTTYNMSLTDNRSTSPNAGLTLTGRGGSVTAALMSLWYKDHVILEGGWASAATSSGNRMSEFDVG